MAFNICNAVDKTSSLVGIEAGIQSNIFIEEINLEKKMNMSTGEQIRRNTYTKLVQLDEDGEQVASSIINWGDIDPTKNWAYDVYCKNVTQMVSILSCFYTQEEINSNFNIFKGFEDTILSSDIAEVVKDRMKSATLTDQLGEEFKKMMEPFLGKTDKLIKIVLVYDKEGRNINLTSSKFIAEPNETLKENSLLGLTAKEKKGFDAAAEFKASVLKDQGIEDVDF